MKKIKYFLDNKVQFSNHKISNLKKLNELYFKHLSKKFHPYVRILDYESSNLFVCVQNSAVSSKIKHLNVQISKKINVDNILVKVVNPNFKLQNIKNLKFPKSAIFAFQNILPNIKNQILKKKIVELIESHHN